MSSGHACGLHQVTVPWSTRIRLQHFFLFTPSRDLVLLNDGTFLTTVPNTIPFSPFFSSHAPFCHLHQIHTSHAGLPGSLRCFFSVRALNFFSLFPPIIYTPLWAHRARHSLRLRSFSSLFRCIFLPRTLLLLWAD